MTNQMIDVVAPRKRASEIPRLVNEVDANSFVIVEETRQIVRGYQLLAQ